MKKARAALAAAVGLTLSATGALAASSAVSTLAQDHAAVGGPNDNHGGAVSTLAQGAHGAPDTTTPGTTTPETTTPDSTETNTGVQGAHGAAVSAVAQDQTAVGGTNDNHGGAVSLVARGTHGPASTHGNSADKSQASVHKPTH
jgi:hypothetical protein